MAIYLVTQDGGTPRMVEARTRVSAISHVARDTFNASALSMKEAIEWTKKGLDLEEAKATEEGEPEAVK